MFNILRYAGLMCVSLAIYEMGYDLGNPVYWLFLIGLCLYVTFSGGKE